MVYPSKRTLFQSTSYLLFKPFVLLENLVFKGAVYCFTRGGEIGRTLAFYVVFRGQDGEPHDIPESISKKQT